MLLRRAIKKLKRELLIRSFAIKNPSKYDIHLIEISPLPKKKEVIIAANRIINHELPVFGRAIDFDFDWQKDHFSGYAWQKNRIYLGRKFVVNNGADPKLPWEISKFFFGPVLGEAYLMTKDRKYAEKAVEYLCSWIDNNPCPYGINWASPMESAVRAVNIYWTLCFLSNSGAFTESVKEKIIKSLYEHGTYLYHFYQLDEPLHHNHVIGDYVGLIYLGLALNNKKWFSTGFNGLLSEIELQFYNDGVHCEGSIYYHKFAVEMMLSAMAICERFGVDLPERTKKRIEKALEFTMYYTRPDGTAPIIGDSDDGMLHNFGFHDIHDHRWLLNIGAALFNRKDFKAFYPPFTLDAYVLLGEEGKKRFDAMPHITLNLGSKGFKDSGFYIMRHGDIHVVIRGPVETVPTKTGHLHNDVLSFELYWDKPIIIDPGTYCYTPYPEERNKFRSTASHNTVMIDRLEQNEFLEGSVFGFKKYHAIGKVNKWVSNTAYDMLDAEHYGYTRLEDPVVHRRVFKLDKKRRQIEICDYFTSNPSRDIKITLIFPKNKLRIKGDTIYHKNIKIKIENHSGSISTEKTDISSHYLTKRKGIKLSVNPEKDVCIIFSKGD